MNTKWFKWGGSSLAVVLLCGPPALADDARDRATETKAETQAETDTATDAGGAAGDKPAGDKPAGEKSAGEKPRKKVKKSRLTKPWKDMTSLTDEQSDKIRSIHRKALAEINAIKAREEEEILALLDEAQRDELETVLDQQSERKAKKPGKKKAAEMADEADAEPAATASE